MLKPLIMAAVVSFAALPSSADTTSLEALQGRIVGTWTSLACEIRPSIDPTSPDGKPIPTYLKRDFTYESPVSFSASITVFLDEACGVPMITYEFAGDLEWHDANPAVLGAYSQDYVLNRALSIVVKTPQMRDQLNALPAGACGDRPFDLNVAQDILGKPCVLLKFVEGKDVVVDHDFLYVRADAPDLLFMGGKHVDGTGFYYPENRPRVGLQQPMIRVK